MSGGSCVRHVPCDRLGIREQSRRLSGSHGHHDGAFEWLASSIPAKAALFRQAAAIFAVAATMLPRPDQFLFASLDRMLAVVLGFAVAVGFFLIPSGRSNSAPV